MSDQLTKEQQEFAHKAATTVFNCLVFKESHAAAFRKDPNRFAEAHERCAANTPSLSSMPLSFEGLEEHIKLNEELIKSMEGCTEFDDRVKVFAACTYLPGLLYHQANLMGQHVKMEVIRIQTQLVSENFPSPSAEPFWPENPLPLLLNQSHTTNPSTVVRAGIHGLLASSQDDSDDYPISMHAPALLWSQILGRPRFKVTDEDVRRYKRDPDLLVQQVFVSLGEDDEEKAFKVFAILTVIEDKIFYLVFPELGNEALAHPSEQFFEMLSTSEEVRIR